MKTIKQKQNDVHFSRLSNISNASDIVQVSNKIYKRVLLHIALVPILVLCMLITSCFLSKDTSYHLTVMSLIVILIYVIVIGFRGLRTNAEYKTAIENMIELDDVRTIEPLIMSLMFDSNSSNQKILYTLSARLNRLEKTDALFLSASAEAKLANAIVHSYYNEPEEQRFEYVIASIHALVVIGRLSQYAKIERLAKQKSRNKTQENIKRILQSELPKWKSEIVINNQPNKLLRASEQPVKDLLSPVEPARTEISEHLLRPVEDDK